MNKLSILKLISTATILAMLLAGLGFSAQPAFALGGDGSIIIDRAWEDLDMDGLQDFSPVAEPDFSGVTVKLYTCAGDFVSSSVTNVSGNATFKDLFAGDYFVEFVAPAGYAFTVQDQGTNDEIDSDADRQSTQPVNGNVEHVEDRRERERLPHRLCAASTHGSVDLRQLALSGQREACG